MFVTRPIVVLLLLTTVASAQIFTVAPTKACTAETIQNQSLACSTDDPCPLFTELAAVEQITGSLFVTGNIHTASTTVESLLLSTQDGGRTWTEAHPRLPQAVLDGIQFVDFQTGWVSGHILQTTPKDAFLLLTSDGGKTWRRAPVASESRTGAIEQFWFDSPSHGLLGIDRVRAAENGMRFEQWETSTGGNSWSIRQVNTTPIPFTKPHRENPLRIRTDGKVHKIEKLNGTRWVTTASISVSAGECRPPEPAAEKEVEATPTPQVEATPPRPAEQPRRIPTLKKK